MALRFERLIATYPESSVSVSSQTITLIPVWLIQKASFQYQKSLVEEAIFMCP